MSIIKQEEIPQLVELFIERNQKFYHACQYQDFQTYLKLGGVPSRSLMERNLHPFTPFETDNVDKQSGHWNLVFGNLQDFCAIFVKGNKNGIPKNVPNPYGPILLVFEPRVFNEANDVAICLRSAGGEDFNRIEEAISISEVVKIYNPKYPDKPYILNAKCKNESDLCLDRKFPNKIGKIKSIEVSCSTKEEVLSFNYLSEIIVDPYEVNRIQLLDKVSQLCASNKLVPPSVRTYKEDTRWKLQQELADYLITSNQSFTLDVILADQNTLDELKKWATNLKNQGITWQYTRFAKYLKEGTLTKIN